MEYLQKQLHQVYALAPLDLNVIILSRIGSTKMLVMSSFAHLAPEKDPSAPEPLVFQGDVAAVEEKCLE